MAGGGMAATSLALLEEPDSLPPLGLDAELAVVEFSGGLRERLLGPGGPVPTLVEPGPASAPPDLADDPANTPEEEGREEEEGVDVIVEDATIADLALRLETSTLDLSRLAGLRPQLILPGTSAWFLIRNPAKVEEFMRMVALEQDAEDQGQVDVAVWIDDRGSVEWSEIARSSGSEELDEIALALFNEVTSFRPALDEGVRVSMSAIFSIAFPW